MIKFLFSIALIIVLVYGAVVTDVKIPFWVANIVLAVCLYGCRAIWGPQPGRPNASGGEAMAVCSITYVFCFIAQVIQY